MVGLDNAVYEKLVGLDQEVYEKLEEIKTSSNRPYYEKLKERGKCLFAIKLST